MTLGFIGLGNMGQGMAQNLLSARPDMWVFDQRLKAMAALAAAGARVASLDDLQACETIVTMLPAGPHVAEVLDLLKAGPP